MEACKARNAKGNACEAPPQKGRDWCYIHDPDRKTDREMSRRLGGYRRRRRAPAANGESRDIDLSTIDGIRDLLVRAARIAEGLDSGVHQVRAMVSVSAQATLLLEKGRLDEEIEKIKRRLEMDDGEAGNGTTI